MLELIQSLILTSAAVVGAVVAVIGLRTWRVQLKGRTEYDLSRRLLRAAYFVRDELAYVRGIIITAGEIEAAAREAGLETSDLDPADDRLVAAVRGRRWKYLKDALSNLDLEELEAEVLWGSEAKDALKPLRTCVSRLHSAAVELGLRSDDDAPDVRAERDRIVQLRRVLHGSGSPDDGFAQTVQDALRSVEEFLRPRLRIQSASMRETAHRPRIRSGVRAVQRRGD